MSFKQQILDIFLNRGSRTAYRPGVVGEIVNGATIPLFAITGGPITASMFGVLTAPIGANATTVQLLHSVTAQAMSTASGNLTGQIAGIHLNPTGAVGAAIAISAGTSVGVFQVTDWSLSIGTIGLLVGGATTATGAIDWYLYWEPGVPNAVVTVR
jgi:hypothetical protein